MEKNNTREEILRVALDLFSVNGYESTSISQIADAVGVKKASIYSHFANKQEIMDTLVEMVLDGYYKHSIVTNADWDNPEFVKDKFNLTVDDYIKFLQDHISYICHNPYVSKGRKLSVIEQFCNEKLSRLLTKVNYEDILSYFTGMMKFLIRCNVLKEADTEIMAAHCALPITVWINLCDREPEREAEVMELVERHIKQFFKIYGK